MVSSVLGGVFLLAVIQTSLPSARAHNTYYVKPTNDTQCPGEPCLTLSQYIQESGKYFVSNTTMLFLLGEHQLDSTFQVENATSFALQGDTSSLPEVPSKIVCNNKIGAFEFNLVQKLNIRALYFSLGDTFIPPSILPIISVFNTKDFHLEACVLESGPSAALSLDGISNGSLLNNIFVGKKAIHNGAAINILICTVMFTNNSFINNERSPHSNITPRRPGAIYAERSSLNFSATTIFFNNSALSSSGGALLCRNTTLVLSGNIDFVSNSAKSGGAIAVLSSALYFNGNVSFKGNSATDAGGAIGTVADIVLRDDHQPISKLYLNPNTTVIFWKNSARIGGAIFIPDINYCPQATNSNCRQIDCFFQVLDQNISTGFSSKLEFVNNSANASGDAIYGGNIDHCNLIGLPASNSSEVFDMITTLEQPQTTSVISSDPLQICGCDNGYPNCSLKYRYPEVYPGETFAVRNIVAVGQRNGTVPANIISFYENADGKQRFGDFETVQTSSRKCGDYHYTVFTLESYNIIIYETIYLYPQGPCPISGESSLKIKVYIHHCPRGFVLSATTGGCVCEYRLMTYTNSCNINNQTILREGNFWVGYDNASESLILSPHCPFDYCKTEPVNFTLNDTDLQCAYNRSGLLCGSCQPGLSLVLGSNRCLRCSNNYLSLLVVFAVAGFILVLFLLACKLTVASGTIDGLVFYANVVSLNKSIFFPPNAINPLTVFIAWINLDLGIETCFYKGMDSYTKTWLQFVFPLYIWALVGLIILLSNFSQKLTRFLGSNPIAVLATLFLLSFARLLGTITSVLAFTKLEYRSHTETVWIFDGEITYLSKNHIALAVVAILAFFILFLPYTMVIFFGQWLLKSKRKVFFWISKPQIRSILDAYYAPYKEEYRYWPGMLLALRFVMLLVYDSTSLTNDNANLLIISAATLGLELWAWIGKPVYRHKYLDILEGSFIFNLGLLAAATYHVRVASGNQAAVVYTSVSVALVTFIGILTYHAFQQLQRWGYCLTFPKLSSRSNIPQGGSESAPISVSHTTVSYGAAIECREPLLDSQ